MSSESPSAWPRWLFVGLVLLIAAGVWWWLRPQYSETSENGYAVAVALFTACNQQDSEKLQELATHVEQLRAQGELGPDEADWLSNIIELGLDGKWPAANRKVRSLMQQQVRPAPS